MKKKALAGIFAAVFTATACAVGIFALGTGCKGDTGAQGEKGDTGVGITSVLKINTLNNEDTYEIRFSNGNTTTFTVTNGVNGENGTNGVGIQSATVNDKGELVIILTDDSELKLGKITGEDGQQGATGEQGIQGEEGKDGATWLYGEGIPSDTANEGDFYLDTQTTNVYIYSANEWTKICSLQGLRGDDAMHANETHTVTYSPNGGALPEDVEASVTVNYGDTLELPIPTRENYTFEGWYTGDTINDGKFTSVTPVTKTIILTARWKANTTFRLLYETNGGNGIAPTAHYFDEEITALPNPVKYDCSFVGWYQDEALSTPVGYPLTLTENTVIYAKWTTAYYYVNFHTNCSETIDAQYASAGTSFDVFSAPENETFSFDGWYLDSGFSKAVEYPFVLHADTDLFAKWNDVYYTFSFVSNGGSQVASQQYRAGVGLDSLPTPTRTNYRFLGWYEDSALTVAVSFPYNVTEGKTLYAKWVWVDPYADYTRIYDTIQFQQINDLNGKYVLMNDLDFENATIGQFGSTSAPFTGTFDGQGYTISNLVLSSSGNYYGLFAVNNGTIINVKFENISQNVSVNKSYVSLLTAENNGTISKVSINGNLSVSTTEKSGYNVFIGSIAATNNGQINNCNVTGKITTTRSYYLARLYVGTITGENYGILYNCISSIALSHSDDSVTYTYFGGISSQNHGEITGVVFIGSISGASTIGAISASTDDTATESNCYEYSNSTGGTAVTIAYLNSISLYVDTLGWDSSIWDFTKLDYENGLYAKLQ